MLDAPDSRFVCTPTFARFSGGSALPDALVSNDAAVKSPISGIDGVKAHYLLGTADGAVSISIFEIEEGASESTRGSSSVHP